MNRTELIAARNKAETNLDRAIALRVEAENRLATVPPSSASASLYRDALRLARDGVVRAGREIGQLDQAISAIESAAAVQELPTEMVEIHVIETIRYASVVVGVGIDPDHPERLKAQAVLRPSKTPICTEALAELMHRFANDLDVQAAQQGHGN